MQTLIPYLSTSVLARGQNFGDDTILCWVKLALVNGYCNLLAQLINLRQDHKWGKTGKAEPIPRESKQTVH